jgi:hypothetical protein
MREEEPNDDDHAGKLGWRAVVIGVIAAVEAVVLAVLALFPPVSIWAVVLSAASVLLAGTLVVSKLPEAKWFPLAAAWTLVAVLVVSTVVADLHRGHPVPSTVVGTSAPTIQFVQTSPATVPWCKYFDLTVSGTIPPGDKILVFDASTDQNYNVTGRYSYDAVAKPVPRIPGEWTAGPVFISSQYVQDGRGHNIIQHGKPVSNTVAVFAVVLPADVMQILDEVGSAAWDLPQLPASPLAHAELDVVRNGDVSPCAPTGDS